MRISQRLISLAVLVALSTALAGCGSTSGFDPTDLLDFLDQKKKLPGDRKPVFPEGVPGLEQGVPKSLYKGAVEDQQAQQAAPAPVEPEPKHKSKRTHAKRTAAPAATPAPDGEATPEEDGGANAAPPAPKPMKQSRRRVTTPPADQPAADTAAPAAPAQSSSPSAFPAPLPSGQFQR